MVAGMATLGGVMIACSLFCLIMIISVTLTRDYSAGFSVFVIISWFFTAALLLMFFLFAVSLGQFVVTFIGCIALFLQVLLAISTFSSPPMIVVAGFLSFGLNVAFYVLTLANLPS
ncbi:hypothetical protein A2223_04150 [Candidatus Falkowbacteria bacterium RIFOXYA2_FULL_35_8]|uniref:Uncharacterized protein n=1 Tax=Candidatus Falkowbacteria bacterium RIFOXYC2_FULL_36_12 TaxID=1798002 RepID=A0A1F5SYI8_9BACT|nr:MAG: hypothetical protein A2300_02825 [Candidatus Falkowbacteria bacterium RIFOXYB2_FULL_35_7]OGF31722.1 MAG: hypothetical protein A2478_04525 [Candidatus Falkowbacteria bacterium RIFOXYC2_FULL_36_12]OGF33650.1 MAG: hypothetical protein A2223_04150 [Candidatus Falkowbacteria bacterium RIFOXYA2_FULL_35_8]